MFDAGGGLAILIKPLLRYKVLRSATHSHYQLLFISVGGAIVIGAYLPSLISHENYQLALYWMRKAVSGPILVFGDLNARERVWDSTTNKWGPMLHKWCTDGVWKIHAPNSAPYAKEQGKSSIDIALTRNLEVEVPHTTHGSWSGASDPSPVVVSTKLRRETEDCLSFTPMAVRKDPELSEAASEIYCRTLPPALAQLDRAATPEQVAQVMECLELSLKQPWAGATTLRPHRFKRFWTTHLDRKARRSSKLYQKAVKSGCIEDWQGYRALDCVIKREARQKKLSASASLSSASLSTVPREPLAVSAEF